MRDGDRMEKYQAAGGARASCGPVTVDLMTDAKAGAVSVARTYLSASAITTGGGPDSACAQHAMPQPAAQGQPVSWLPGGCEPSAAEAQRLEANGLAAAIDNGNSSACSATT